jgi:hypothetical protein
MKGNKFEINEKRKQERERGKKDKEALAQKLKEKFPDFTVEELKLLFPHLGEYL